jgi:hypothetical protein
MHIYMRLHACTRKRWARTSSPMYTSRDPSVHAAGSGSECSGIDCACAAVLYAAIWSSHAHAHIRAHTYTERERDAHTNAHTAHTHARMHEHQHQAHEASRAGPRKQHCGKSVGGEGRQRGTDRQRERERESVCVCVCVAVGALRDVCIHRTSSIRTATYRHTHTRTRAQRPIIHIHSGPTVCLCLCACVCACVCMCACVCVRAYLGGRGAGRLLLKVLETIAQEGVNPSQLLLTLPRLTLCPACVPTRARECSHATRPSPPSEPIQG